MALIAGVLVLTVGTAAAGAGFPQATFLATLSGKSPRFLNGPWRLSFFQGGRYTTEHPLNEFVARDRIGRVQDRRSLSLDVQGWPPPLFCNLRPLRRT